MASNTKKNILNNKIQLGKRSVITTILSMYPQLKNEKNTILEKIFEKKNKGPIPQDLNMIKEIILERLIYKNKIYYVDKFGIILNNKAEVCGMMCKNKHKDIVMQYDIDILNQTIISDKADINLKLYKL